jgi:hypothetical protein
VWSYTSGLRGPGALVFERIEALLGQPKKIRLPDLQVVRVNDG